MPHAENLLDESEIRSWGLATLDFTIKMTGVAKGQALRSVPLETM